MVRRNIYFIQMWRGRVGCSQKDKIVKIGKALGVVWPERPPWTRLVVVVVIFRQFLIIQCVMNQLQGKNMRGFLLVILHAAAGAIVSRRVRSALPWPNEIKICIFSLVHGVFHQSTTENDEFFCVLGLSLTCDGYCLIFKCLYTRARVYDFKFS